MVRVQPTGVRSFIVQTRMRKLTLADGGERAWRVGAHCRVTSDATLEGVRGESANGDAHGHGLMLRCALRW